MPGFQVRLPLARLACALIVLAALPLGGCAKVPVVGGKPEVTLKLTALPKANSCGKDAGNSMAFRVLQVTDASGLTGMSLTQLWDREDKVLGAAFVKKDEGFIDPGKAGEFKFERDPKAKAVVFVGSFCRPQGSCWYYSQPLSKGSSLKLTIDEYCVTASKK